MGESNSFVVITWSEIFIVSKVSKTLQEVYFETVVLFDKSLNISTVNIGVEEVTL